MVNPENHSVDDTRNRQYSQSPPDIVHIEMDRLDRPLSREAPGDTQRTHQEKELARKKSQYYEDTFATRPSQSSARERVLRETVVLAEITTNVTVCQYSLSNFKHSILTSPDRRRIHFYNRLIVQPVK
jgi:hypothetical protein